jgi:hypothetical protein
MQRIRQLLRPGDTAAQKADAATRLTKPEVLEMLTMPEGSPRAYFICQEVGDLVLTPIGWMCLTTCDQASVGLSWGFARKHDLADVRDRAKFMLDEQTHLPEWVDFLTDLTAQ